jgi:hypothetical protein
MRIFLGQVISLSHGNERNIMNTDKNIIMLTGLLGLAASLFVGLGEFLLHYDNLARYDGGYMFFEAVGQNRATVGHFIGVLSAPLYVIGVWHIAKMLSPASKLWSTIAFFVMSYGFMVGAIWIGSRASAAALVSVGDAEIVTSLLSLYELRYETLLGVIRLTALVFSIIYIVLIVSGRTAYPRWMAIFNPLLLILGNFLIFYLLPEIGKYLMPIALNVSFFIIFSISLFIAKKNSNKFNNN